MAPHGGRADPVWTGGELRRAAPQLLPRTQGVGSPTQRGQRGATGGGHLQHGGAHQQRLLRHRARALGPPSERPGADLQAEGRHSPGIGDQGSRAARPQPRKEPKPRPLKCLRLVVVAEGKTQIICDVLLGC